MPKPLETPICDLLDCRYPVILAGMGGPARAELVAAVTNAGGFGFLGMVREPPELIRAEVAQLRAATNRDFGVNLIPAATPADLLDAQIKTCLELKVPVMGLFWDVVPGLVRDLRAAGVIVVWQVGNPEDAAAAQAAGAHALIVQGVEAGGHVRGTTPLMPLLAEIAPRATIPVLAAGGLVDGADLARVLRAGAQGAVLGTAFLACEESFAHPYHKRRIVDAVAGDTLHTEIFHINWPIGAPVRVLANSVTRGLRGDPFQRERHVIGAEGDRPIYLFSTDSPLRSMSGDFEAMALYAGEGAARIDRVLPAGERLQAIVAEAEEILGGGDATAAAGHEGASFSSPACFARNADDGYMGYLDRAGLLALLNDMLKAGRARARVALRTGLEAQTPGLKQAADSLYREEARGLTQLRAAIAQMGSKADDERAGPLYGRAMSLADGHARLRTLAPSLETAAQTLEAALPKIRDDELHKIMTDMAAAQRRRLGALAHL